MRKETGGPAEWIEILWNTATRQGYGKFFVTLPARISGSHLAFRKAGIPALALVDDSPTMVSMSAASNQRYDIEKAADTDGSIVGGAINDGGSAEISTGLLTNNTAEMVHALHGA